MWTTSTLHGKVHTSPLLVIYRHRQSPEVLTDWIDRRVSLRYPGFPECSLTLVINLIAQTCTCTEGALTSKGKLMTDVSLYRNEASCLTIDLDHIPIVIRH